MRMVRTKQICRSGISIKLVYSIWTKKNCSATRQCLFSECCDCLYGGRTHAKSGTMPIFTSWSTTVFSIHFCTKTIGTSKRNMIKPTETRVEKRRLSDWLQTVFLIRLTQRFHYLEVHFAFKFLIDSHMGNDTLQEQNTDWTYWCIGCLSFLSAFDCL